MAHRLSFWLLSLVGAALVSGCIETNETLAIRNDTTTPLTATVDLQGDFEAYDCADESGRATTSVSGPTALTIAPGRRLCLRAPASGGDEVIDAVHRLTVARGEVVCVEGDSDSLRKLITDEVPLPTLRVVEADCE